MGYISNPRRGITPTGTKQITQNGTHDVTEYASANVNVPGGGGYGIPMSVTANSIYSSSPKQPWQAFGDIPGNFWGSGGRSGNYIQMLFGTPVAVAKIKFSNYYRINTSTYWHSSNVAIRASNDNFATYTELYSGTGIAQSETQIEVSLQNTTKYLAYRLVCSDSTAYVGLGRIELMGDGSGGGGGGVLTDTTPPDVALGADGDFYVQTSNEGVLTSDGACYIDTSIIPNALYAVEIVAALTQQTTNYDTLFGTRNGSAGRFTARFGNGSNGTLDVHKSSSPTASYSTWSTGQTKSTMLNTYIRLYLKDMLRVNGVFRNGATISSVNAFPYSLFLFANNNAGSVSDYACCAIKSFKVWDNNGDLIMYLMPASYNGEACMYDLVTGQYFQNSGNGTFTYTDLSTPFDAILWKKVSGAWTIVSEWG